MGVFKALMLIFVISQLAYSLEITINYGKENSKDFSVLNLKNSKPFPCKENFDHEGVNFVIECVIDAIPQEGFTPLKTGFFEIYYKMIDKEFHLYVEPRKKQKLFAIPSNLEKDGTIFKEKPTSSKAWQIIGYEDSIPFLSNQASRGIDFPIHIENAQTPYIPELDINNEPLNFTKGPDFDAYMKAKSLLESHSYIEALNAINDTLKRYPNTIFKKDLYLYQIIALCKSNQKQQDVIIETALNWIKQYPSDTALPQVLYILAKAYSEIRYDSESQYYYKRIIEEYAQNRYAPLAKMQLAIMANNSQNIGLASIYFQQAYAEAKDLESASEIALNWAKFEVFKQNLKNAQTLVEKILNAYPQFFTLDPQKTYQTMLFFEKSHLDNLAAQIGEYLLKHTENVSIQEQVSYDLGRIYEEAKDFDKAHMANIAYIKAYRNNPRAKSVEQRDDDILFQVSGDNEEKIKRYDYIIKKYPDTAQSDKALKLKAKLLIDEKHYTKALDLRKDLGEDSPLIQEALNSLIKEYLQKDDCKNANIYLIQTTQYDLNNEEKLKAFDCLYNASLYKNAEILTQGMAKNSKKPTDKLAWLYRDAKNLYQLRNYKTSILAAKDAFSLARSSNNTQYLDIGFTLFADLAAIKNKTEAFKLSGELEKLFKDDKRMIKVYATLLNWESQVKNDTTIQIYASNIIALQNQFKIDTYTPYAQFELINSLVRTQKTQEALKQVDELLQNNLTNEQKQKALYTKGSIENLQNNAENAKAAFEACINIKGESAWKNLCTQGLDLFKQQ